MLRKTRRKRKIKRTKQKTRRRRRTRRKRKIKRKPSRAAVKTVTVILRFALKCDFSSTNPYLVDFYKRKNKWLNKGKEPIISPTAISILFSSPQSPSSRHARLTRHSNISSGNKDKVFIYQQQRAIC